MENNKEQELNLDELDQVSGGAAGEDRMAKAREVANKIKAFGKWQTLVNVYWHGGTSTTEFTGLLAYIAIGSRIGNDAWEYLPELTQLMNSGY